MDFRNFKTSSRFTSLQMGGGLYPGGVGAGGGGGGGGLITGRKFLLPERAYKRDLMVV